MGGPGPEGAFRWTAAGGFESLATLGGNVTHPLATSADGSVITGYARDQSGVDRAVIWRSDGTIGSSYCPGAPNSSSATGAALTLTGVNKVDGPGIELRVGDLPLNSFCFFLASRQPGFVYQPAGSFGNLCLSGAIGRYVGPGQIQNSGVVGEVSLTIDPGAMMTPSGPILPPFGDTWYFQMWYRDANPGPTSNFTSAVRLAIY